MRNVETKCQMRMKRMRIRKAEEKDLERILALLSEVLEIHAAVRPDIFVPGTTKYSKEELRGIVANENTPVYVAADEEDEVLGYVFCVLRSQPASGYMVPFRSIYIDDLCVDEKARGLHVGRALFEFVKEEARRRGCYEITLNVWEGNDGAKAFYEKMGLRPMSTHLEYILGEKNE